MGPRGTTVLHNFYDDEDHSAPAGMPGDNRALAGMPRDHRAPAGMTHYHQALGYNV